MNTKSKETPEIDWQVSVAEGKYTLQHFASGDGKALRYGEEWPARDIVGDNMLFAFGIDLIEAQEKVRSLELRLREVHLLLDNDPSKIIRNAKDGYPDGRPDRELTLLERAQALCKYASDWKRWHGEKEKQLLSLQSDNEKKQRALNLIIAKEALTQSTIKEG